MKKTIFFCLTISLTCTIILSCNKPETISQVDAPTISSFTPIKDTAGGIVTILGTNFSSTASNNEVKFNSTTSTIISATNTTLKVKVPNGLTTISTISVKTAGQTASSATNFKLATSLEMLIGGKWFYKSSILSDTEFVSNNNVIYMLPWPFSIGTNPQTNYDTSFNFITFSENGISNNSRYAWGSGQAGLIYRDTVSFTQINNNIYLNFPAGINGFSQSPGFSYPAYQDTIIVNSISQNSLVFFRRYHQKHYSNSNNVLNKKLSLDSLVKY